MRFVRRARRFSDIVRKRSAVTLYARHGGVAADGIHRQTHKSGAERVGEWIAPMRAEHREQKAAILTTTSRVENTCGQA